MQQVWNELPLNSSNSRGLHKRQSSCGRLPFYYPSYFRDKVINCEVCIHIKCVSKSVNSAGLLQKGMFSNNHAQLSLNFSDIYILMHRYAIDWFLNLFIAETTVLFVANRQGNTLKIVCSGAADYGRLVKTNVK